MIALAGGLMIGGYVLMFAAVANGGVFALRPWAAFLADAYSVESAPPSVRESGVDPATGRPLRESGGGRQRPGGVDPDTGRPLRESG